MVDRTPACNHEQAPPEEWWADLALRLKKAVYVMSDKPEVWKVFHAAEVDARVIAILMKRVARDRLRAGDAKSSAVPG